jgi:hypothetical protein
MPSTNQDLLSSRFIDRQSACSAIQMSESALTVCQEPRSSPSNLAYFKMISFPESCFLRTTDKISVPYPLTVDDTLAIVSDTIERIKSLIFLSLFPTWLAIG